MHGKVNDSGVMHVVLVCPICSDAILASITPDGSFYQNFSGRAHDAQLLGPHRQLKRVLPAPNVIAAPANTPSRVGDVYIEAVENFRGKRWDTCVGLCRKALDLATRALQEDALWKLEKRIRDLSDKRLITPEMAEWAEEIRIDGNDAVHDDRQFTEHEAEQIVAFTETFLFNAFTLPAMLKARRSREEPSTEPPSTPT
jgi:hypothetical protein